MSRRLRARINVTLVFGQQVNVVKHKTVPLVASQIQRLDIADVHEHSSVEGEISEWLDDEYSVLYELFGEEEMHVSEKEVEVFFAVTVGHDYGYFVSSFTCPW